MEQKLSSKIRNGWLSAACALTLIWASLAPRTTIAQQTTPSSKTVGNRTTQTQTKTANSKNHTKPTAKRASATTSSAKAHAASHSTANSHFKSTAAANRKSKSKQVSLRRNGKHRTARGQQKIDPERAQAIQEALIREHYLSGEAAGTWNQASEDAMRRYQADHGWQSKTVPDSRALISLGLGPSHDHLLNPQSAMTTGPDAPRATSLTPASQSADPGAHLNANPTSPSDSAPASSSSQDGPGPQ